MPKAVLAPVVDDVLEIEELERAWYGAASGDRHEAPPVKSAQLTITRNTSGDFQDRQVFLYLDGELWGKVKYGRPVTREIAPGRHTVRAFNTLFSHTVEVDAASGEHVRLRCSNGMPTAGWMLMVFLHVTCLFVKLERE